ncbi:sulfatase-like hydrolase/transferase [Candidatus Gottesmanbacteria bacterium]|nr:sulfatase-like hydrolase/transferase [Candidatus Gottesmanbacteria bacterium]
MNIETVIFFSIDSLRADCAPYQKQPFLEPKLPRLWTPTLRHLMYHASCFTNVYSSAVFTPPAHATLFTGAYQPDHHVREFYYRGQTLNPKLPTLAEFFKKQGFATCAFTDMAHLFSALGLLRGFDQVSNKDSAFFHHMTTWKRSKRFIFIHLLDVHTPYLFSLSDLYVDNNDYYKRITREIRNHGGHAPRGIGHPDPYVLWNTFVQLPTVQSSQSRLLPLYIEGVNKFDKGRLRIFLDQLNQHTNGEKTVMFLFSDHGEGQASHLSPTLFRHGPHLADDVLHIPLMISSPSFRQTRNNQLLSLRDVYDLTRVLLETPTQEAVDAYQNPDRFIYAESFEYRKSGLFTNPDRAYAYEVRDRQKTDYYLYERVIRTPQNKLTVWFRPELFFGSDTRFRSLKKAKKNLKTMCSAYPIKTSLLLRLLLIVIALCSSRWKKAWTWFIRRRLSPMFRYEPIKDGSVNELFGAMLRINHVRNWPKDLSLLQMMLS